MGEGGGLDVYDKGSHFLVSDFMGGGAGGVRVVWVRGLVGLV